MTTKTQLIPELPSTESAAYEKLFVVCEYTGLTITLCAPSLPGLVLQYKNPLADYKNALLIAKKGRAYLSRFDQQTLSALVLSIYRHFGLFQLGSLPSAAAANQLIRHTNPKETLVFLIWFAGKYISATNAFRLPQFNLEALQDFRTNTEDAKLGSLNSYLDQIKPYLIDLSELEQETLDAAAQKITIHRLSRRAQAQIKLAKFEISLDSPQHSINQAEIEFELQFKELKKEAAALLKELPIELPEKMRAILAQVTKDRNLVTVSSDLRQKLITRLKDNGAPTSLRFAQILKDCHNPYDIFGDVSELESGLDLSPKAETPVFSIADILSKRNHHE